MIYNDKELSPEEVEAYHARNKENKQYPGPIYKYDNADLWHGNPGFSKERWAFWKERLGWIALQDEFRDQTRKVAQRLIRCMEQIEQEPETDIWKDWIESGENYMPYYMREEAGEGENQSSSS